MTFGDIYKKFIEKYPKYAEKIEDFRPSRFMNGICIWLKGFNFVCVSYNENTDKFELLDIDNYSFYMKGE